MHDWQSLDEELNLWRDNDQCAAFWWRDDDACAPTPHLRRMLDIAARHDAPLALAVIPSALKPELAQLLNPRVDVSVLQHGFAHLNHASVDEKKSEFGADRNVETVRKELSTGQRMLEIFDHALPILVPPWNRIAPAQLDTLADIGFTGVSTYAARRSPLVTPELAMINTHVDIIDWHGTGGFVGTDAAIALTVAHLQAKRSGAADATEPTGLLSHHLVHDEGSWDFIEAFLHHLKTHDGAHVVNVAVALP